MYAAIASRSAVSDCAAAITGSAWSRKPSSVVRVAGEHVVQADTRERTPERPAPAAAAAPASNTALQQPGPVLVVVEDARLRDAGQRRHLTRGHPGDPALAQQFERSGEDRLASAGGRPPTASGSVIGHRVAKRASPTRWPELLSIDSVYMLSSAPRRNRR